MSNTPRTDAASFVPRGIYIGRIVEYDFSCKLETELAAVTAERDALKAKLATINHIAMSLFVRNTSCEVTGEMAEIGRLSREDGK